MSGKRLSVKDKDGAEGETRTRTGISPLPPQGSVSTNFTTSACSYVVSKVLEYRPALLRYLVGPRLGQSLGLARDRPKQEHHPGLFVNLHFLQRPSIDRRHFASAPPEYPENQHSPPVIQIEIV